MSLTWILQGYNTRLDISNKKGGLTPKKQSKMTPKLLKTIKSNLVNFI